MTLKINFSAMQARRDIIGFWVDVFMMFLIVINLAFIIFDFHFEFAFFRRFLENLSPAFYAYYRDAVHPNFILYDSFFVTIYLLELGVSWVAAIKRKTYDRWFFYPIFHWYDVLGCIPVGTFRWLRILRIFSIMIRLHKMKAIDLRETYFYKEGLRVYKIIMEEISDKVVIKILNGIESEIKRDNPVTTRMVSEILKPHQETLARWISHRIRHVAEHNYNIYRTDLKGYIEESISQAVKQNKEIKKIGTIPIVGKQIITGLEEGVSNITFEAINGLVQGLSSEENTKVIEDAINAMFESLLVEEEDKELNRVIKEIFIRAIGLVKEQVKVKRWREEGDDEETAFAVQSAA